MKMSKEGIARLCEWEGKVVRGDKHFPYDDATGKLVAKGGNFEGYLTIGYGHLLDRSELNSECVELNGRQHYYWFGLFETEAEELLDLDVDWAEKVVNDNVNVTLTQNQFEALVSFTFNVGGSAFRKSTLLKRINANNFEDVPKQFRRWIRSGGKVMKGLITRREHEIQHWEGK